MPATATSLDHKGRSIRLKWHQLRQKPDDPPFSPANLRAGLAVGASLEVDLQPLADGEWVCLHDAELAGETDGTGPVARLRADEARQLRIKTGDFAPMLLSDLVSALEGSRPGACLQIDLKAEPGAVTKQAAARFAALVDPVARHCLLSGPDWAAVTNLGASVAGLRLGYDPSDLLAELAPFGRSEIEATLKGVRRDTPGAAAYYLSHEIVAAAMKAGINPVGALQDRGAMLDVWTLDPTTPYCPERLAMAAEAGADQITTNDPDGIAAIWARQPSLRGAE